MALGSLSCLCVVKRACKSEGGAGIGLNAMGVCSASALIDCDLKGVGAPNRGHRHAHAHTCTHSCAYKHTHTQTHTHRMRIFLKLHLPELSVCSRKTAQMI